MRTTGYGRYAQRARLPLWIRVLAVLAAGWAALTCGQRVVDAYGSTMDYRDAPVCAAGSDDDGCVRRVPGTVLDRRTGVECTETGSGTTAGGETHGGGTGGSTTTCRRYHDVEVEWPGRTEWLGVAGEAYEKAGKGDRAEVRLWRGEAVGLKVAGHTIAYAPDSEEDVSRWLVAGFLAAVVCLWAAVSGRFPASFMFSGTGWLFVAVGVGWIGSLILLGGHFLTWVFALVWMGFVTVWTVNARR